MKRFIVLEATDKYIEGELFHARTEISKMVQLPFTTEEYRCTMFNGMDIKLINGDKIIKATLR
jgi:hypothetical protein